jgi:hypothetical protein
MALPIAPTPILWGREAKKFEQRLADDLNNPTTLKPTPKLEEARRIVRSHVDDGKKHI